VRVSAFSICASDFQIPAFANSRMVTLTTRRSIAGLRIRPGLCPQRLRRLGVPKRSQSCLLVCRGGTSRHPRYQDSYGKFSVFRVRSTLPHSEQIAFRGTRCSICRKREVSLPESGRKHTSESNSAREARVTPIGRNDHNCAAFRFSRASRCRGDRASDRLDDGSTQQATMRCDGRLAIRSIQTPQPSTRTRPQKSQIPTQKIVVLQVNRTQ